MKPPRRTVLILGILLILASVAAYVSMEYQRVVFFNSIRNLTPAQAAAGRARLHLDEPLIAQYGTFLLLAVMGVLFTGYWIVDQPQPALQRGCPLTGLLLLMLIASSLVSLFFIVTFGESYSLPSSASFWVWESVLVLSVWPANYVFALALWRWRKWGMFGLIAVSAFSIIAGLTLGAALVFSFGLTGFVAAGILALLFRPFWKQMK